MSQAEVEIVMRYRTKVIDVAIDFGLFSEIVANFESVTVRERARYFVFDDSFDADLQYVELQRMRGQSQELIETC